MKKYLSIMIMCILSLLFAVNVYADSAYSVGCKYTEASNYDENTSQLVYDAANAYYQANINSYYNLEPTYSYLKSQTRLGGSRAFFIAGHAGYNYIQLASRGVSGSEYWTGIHTGSNGELNYGYTYAGLEGRNMSATKVITFAGCETDQINNKFSLAKIAVGRGAHAATGWMYRMNNEQNWMRIYNYSLGAGYSVYDSAIRANNAYPDTSTSLYWYIQGNLSSKITTTGTDTNNISRSEKISMLFEKERLIISQPLSIKNSIDYKIANSKISDLYETISFSDLSVPQIDNNLFYNEFHEYKNQFNNLFETIKKYDPTFNEDDYKMMYKIQDKENGVGLIQFVYYISEKIRTNKVYTITFDEYKVTNIYLGGVRKENIDNVNKVDMENIKTKISNFEENKAVIVKSKIEKFYKKTPILNIDNSLSKLNLSDNVIDFEEYYRYDFNTNKLSYIVDITEEIENNIDMRTSIIEI